MVTRVLLAAVLACLLAPAAAHASQAFVAGSQLVYVAFPGETNQVVVKRVGSTHEITDKLATITPGAFCAASGPNKVVCSDPPSTLTLIAVGLGDGEDRARIQSPFSASVNGGPGTDDLTGGNGADTLTADRGPGDRLTGGNGNDSLNAPDAGGRVVLLGGAGNDVLNAPSNPDIPAIGNNRLTGGPGVDTLNGSPAADLLTGGPGPDRMAGGGSSSDQVRYDDHAAAVTVTIGDGLANDGNATDEGVVNGVTRRDEVLGDVEFLFGTDLRDTITGSDASEGIFGGLFGGRGSDTLNGAGGDDRLCGGGVPPAPDSLLVPACTGGGSGADVLSGGAGNDTLQGTLGADTHNGGTGRDTAMWTERSAVVRVTINDCATGPQCAQANDGQPDISSNPGQQPEGDLVALDVENLEGGAGADSLSGDADPNVLEGGFGGDTLRGQGGDDVLCGLFDGLVAGECTQGLFQPGDADGLDGGAGNDHLDGYRGADQIIGGAGIDTASYASRSGDVSATLNDALANDGEAGEGDLIANDVENLLGGDGDDLLRGTGDPNVLVGGDGTDTLEGLVGRDVLEPGRGAGDVVAGGSSFDFVSYRGFFAVNVSLDDVANDGFTGENDDVRTDVEGIMGSDSGDVLTGHAGTIANTLIGYGGADTLDARGGDDALIGGDGADTFLAGEGNDYLNAVDEAADPTIDCGPGVGDRVQYDDPVDVPSACETLEPFAAPAFALARW